MNFNQVDIMWLHSFEKEDSDNIRIDLSEKENDSEVVSTILIESNYILTRHKKGIKNALPRSKVDCFDFINKEQYTNVYVKTNADVHWNDSVKKAHPILWFLGLTPKDKEDYYKVFSIKDHEVSYNLIDKMREVGLTIKQSS